ncbi:hypothetical protein Salat_1953400 [Sesamum alatum]|uniref:Uncharacterized protein n=1 Tax=Sesamum alatum TaxID=300844 RepID=A0AAE1Y517_9LAMI|nr:hypothetical protein Salat_1953400 [Sesamum alatum]
MLQLPSSCLRGSTGLADLNEPVEAEETMAPSSVDFLGRTSENAETKSMNQPTKLNAGFTRANLSSLSQGRQPDKLPLPSHPVQCMPNQGHPPPAGIYPSGYSREDLWREGLRHGLESSDRSHDTPIIADWKYSFLIPLVHILLSSSCCRITGFTLVSSWAKPSSFLKRLPHWKHLGIQLQQ